MDASVRLLEFYGYSDAAVTAAPVAAQTNRLTGVGNKRDYTLIGFSCTPYASVNACPFVSPPGTSLNFVATKDALIDEYIYIGWQTAQILCRNYLAGLSEKNSAFEAIRKELNISGGLAQLTMQTAMAGGRAIAYFGAAQSFLNSTLDNFADYEFLTPDQAALQDLVLRAQASLADYYRRPEGHPMHLVGAINAVHTIEFQCTRPGLRRLISRAVITGQPEVRSGVVVLTQPEPAPTPRQTPTPRPASPAGPSTSLLQTQIKFTAALVRLQELKFALATDVPAALEAAKAKLAAMPAGSAQATAQAKAIEVINDQIATKIPKQIEDQKQVIEGLKRQAANLGGTLQ